MGEPRWGADHPEVDVAIVAESTYPYHKGGVAAVIDDIVKGNKDLTFGIIHITWDSTSPRVDLYGMPSNVLWVRPVYLSMSEHEHDFRRLTPKLLRMGAADRRLLAHRLLDAVHASIDGDPEPLWQLYDVGMNPRTRAYPLWALLGAKEFMGALRERLTSSQLPLTDTFWLVREFFSLTCALLGEDFPKARVYHAHTTGYASLLGVAAARQNRARFFLTEHALYVRDTVNLLLGRSMGQTLSANDWRELQVTPRQRAWMAWYIEMGRFCYYGTEIVTYLYPKAITEAADLGAPVERSVVIPNGIVLPNFEEAFQQRQRVLPKLRASGANRQWKLACIARVVPLKGVSDLIAGLALLVERGVDSLHLDVLGPTDADPDYYKMCQEKARALGVEDYVTFRGTVDVAESLAEFDILMLPSHTEAQPMVVLEAMTAGIPTVGTSVGGMEQLVEDPLTTRTGHTWGPCGLLVAPRDIVGLADAAEKLMSDKDLYVEYAVNARGRVLDFFRFEDTMEGYNRLYRELGWRSGVGDDDVAAKVEIVGRHRMDAGTPLLDRIDRSVQQQFGHG